MKKQKIANIARKLIRELEFCNDEEFVEFVLRCVTDNDSISLEPQYL